MSKDQAVPGRVRLWGFALLMFFLSFFGFISPKSPAVIVPLATVLIFTGWLLEKKNLAVLHSKVWGVVLAVECLAAVSLLWAPDHQIALDRLLKLAVFIPAGTILVLVAAQSTNIGGDWLRKFLLAGLGIGILLLAWAVVTFSPLGDLLHPSLHYFQGPSGENRGAVVLMLLATAGLLAARRILPTPWIFAATVCLGILLMFAASQTAFAAFLVWVAALIAGSAYPSFLRQVVIWGGAAFIVAQPFLVLALEWADPSRSIDIEAASAGARLDIWIAVAHKSMEAPFLGHGLEATRSITDWANEFHYFNGTSIPHPHNGILQIWIEFGLVGALAAALIWISVVRSLDLFRKTDQAALLAFASVLLVVIGISHGLWQSWWLFAAFGAIAVTLTQTSRHAPSRS